VYVACFYAAPINKASANTLRAEIIATRVALRQQLRAFYYQTVSMDRILAPLLLACLCSAARSTKRVPDWRGHAGSWQPNSAAL